MARYRKRKQSSFMRELGGFVKGHQIGSELAELFGASEIKAAKQESKKREQYNKIIEDLTSEGFQKVGASVDEDGNVHYKLSKIDPQKAEENAKKLEVDKLKIDNLELDKAIKEGKLQTIRSQVQDLARKQGGASSFEKELFNWQKRIRDDGLTKDFFKTALSSIYNTGRREDALKGKKIYDTLLNMGEFPEPEEEKQGFFSRIFSRD